MKVEQDYLHGEIETEEKTGGTVLHEQLLATEKTTLDKIIENIESRPICVASFPIVAKFDDMILSGIPDAVVFVNARPAFIIELKTTKGKTTVVYDGQKAQTDVYGLLLDLLGFDCSNLKIVITKFKKESPLNTKQKTKFLSVLVSSLLEGKHKEFALASKNSIVAHISDYNKTTSSNIIEQTKGYWLHQREPIATTNPRKCMSCEFNKLCPSSLAKE